MTVPLHSSHVDYRHRLSSTSVNWLLSSSFSSLISVMQPLDHQPLPSLCRAHRPPPVYFRTESSFILIAHLRRFLSLHFLPCPPVTVNLTTPHPSLPVPVTATCSLPPVTVFIIDLPFAGYFHSDILFYTGYRFLDVFFFACHRQY